MTTKIKRVNGEFKETNTQEHHRKISGGLKQRM